TGAQVTLAHAGRHLLEHMFPASLTAHLEQTFADHGVTVVPGFRLMGIGTGEELMVHAGAAESLGADVVVLGLGAELNTNLAAHAGLDLDRGAVVVDPSLRTSSPDVYAAGDIALFDDPLLGCATSGTSTTPKPPAPWPGRTWPAPRSRTSTRRCSSRTCS